MTPNPYYAADADQEWRDEQAARRDYHRDRNADEPVDGRCPEWCDYYNRILGVPACGETFPRCELMRDLRATK